VRWQYELFTRLKDVKCKMQNIKYRMEIVLTHSKKIVSTGIIAKKKAGEKPLLFYYFRRKNLFVLSAPYSTGQSYQACTEQEHGCWFGDSARTRAGGIGGIIIEFSFIVCKFPRGH
jgi:hypothetical protein